MSAPVFVLVHSPLVGPGTWSPVAERLRARGAGAVVPPLRDRGPAAGPFWRQHALSAAVMIQALPAGRPLVLVGHSGAGPLLPAIRHAAERDVAAYIFVDAGIPAGDASRLALLRSEMPDAAEQFEMHLSSGGRYPAWQDEDLRGAIPDGRLRQRVLREMQPRDLPFWTEPLPAVPGWPDAPCGYLQLSEGYDVPAARARADGWMVQRLDGGHFHMLVDPDAVTDALLDLARGAGLLVAAEAGR